MNKRIEELSKQANAWYPDGYPSGEGGDAAWQNYVIFEKEDLQKFSELIVQECIRVSEAHAKNLEAQPSDLQFEAYDDGIVNGIYEATAAIKEHFGVE